GSALFSHMSRRAFAALVAGALLVLDARGAVEPPIVPAPASVKPRAGAFVVSGATALVVDQGDIGAQRAAANFAALVARTHGLRLRIRHDRPANAIAFRRAREGPAEGYRID